MSNVENPDAGEQTSAYIDPTQEAFDREAKAAKALADDEDADEAKAKKAAAKPAAKKD